MFALKPKVDIRETKVIRVLESESLNILLNGSLSSQVRCIKDGKDSQTTGPLKIDKVRKEDAGKYTCKVLGEDGSVKQTYTITVLVEVPFTVEMSIKVLNYQYTEKLKDNSSQEYKKFEAQFKSEMDKAFLTVIPGYKGIQILNISKGSVQVRFRIRIIVTIKNPSQTTTGANVNTTQTLINNVKDGYIGKLQVDPKPESMQISAPPPSPENIRLLGVSKDGANIAWDRPKNHLYFAINGYFIEYWSFGSKTKKTSDTFKGVSVRLSGLQPETSYVARVVATNKNGRGLESDDIDIKTEASGTFPAWAIAVIGIACLIILLILILACICHRRRKKRMAAARDEATMRKLDKIKESYPKSYVNKTMMTISEKCTIYSKENIVLLYELGSGEFGVVYMGQLLNDKNEVMDCAVKTFKDNASDDDVRDLYQELEIMINIGYHENLINVLGACEQPDGKRDKLFVLVEYARHGSLINYLNELRQNPWKSDCEYDLHYVNRLNIALDVAKGMAYLASKRCVHRDLAARNVLLADYFVAKVADFGLSRDIYETGQYEKTTGGKLPTRWMALESLEQRKFTLESDVWSFGVLLWEIETKGLLPHGAISFKELVHKQKNGYRLEQPEGTPDKLYRLMGICWSADPKKRPSFSQICDLLEVLKDEEQKEKRMGNRNLEETTEF